MGGPRLNCLGPSSTMEDMLKRRNLSGLINALCVSRRKNLWIISFCIVGWAQPPNVRDVVVARKKRMKKSWKLGSWSLQYGSLLRLAIWWATWKEENGHIF